MDQHEPQCREAYKNHLGRCICRYVRAAFREGYNAHAASQAHWEATHGAYPQHGKGENP